MSSLIFGIPLIGNFGDFVALIPYELSNDSFDAFVEVCTTLGIRRKKKTDFGRLIIFLGLHGNFPRPGNTMTLLIRLHPQKAETWILMPNRIDATGSISRKELESVSGGHSSTQTSAFGRIGRAMSAPLYTKLHLDKCYPARSLKEATSMRWRDMARAHLEPRKSTPKHPRTERIVHTDTTGETQIVAAACLAPASCASPDRLGSVSA